MHLPLYIYDPTANDPLSKVRGVGRYLQILREQFSEDATFTNNLGSVPRSSVLINPFFSILKKPFMIRKKAKKQIAVIHDIIPLKHPVHYPSGIKGNIFSLLNTLTLKNYDMVITDSLHSKRDIINYLRLDDKKVKVVYPTLPNLFTNPKSQIPNPKQSGAWNLELGAYCLYVGDATWNKNLVNLAKAIKLADIPCVFVGKVFEPLASGSPVQFTHPWQSELSEFAKEVKKDSRFIFPGYIPNEDLLGYYKHARLNILVSRDEGFGFSYLEASSQGCPTLLSDIPIFREICQNSALFCNGENPEDIAKKIGKIWSDNDLRSSIALNAKKRLEFFTEPGKFKKDILDAINSL